MSCLVNECDRPATASRGMCWMHYARWQRQGDPGEAEARQAAPGMRGVCSLEGCESPVKARRLCSMHYRRWLEKGDPGPVEPKKHDRDGICGKPYCLAPINRSGLCSMHYYRRLKGQKGWQRPTQRLDPLDIAWLAGLFEGEGCIHVGGKTGNRTRLTVNMTDADVVTRCRDLTGVGSLRWREHPQWKPQLIWSVSHRRDVARLLLAMVPLLGERRRAKALEAGCKLEQWSRRS